MIFDARRGLAAASTSNTLREKMAWYKKKFGNYLQDQRSGELIRISASLWKIRALKFNKALQSLS